MKKFIQLLFVNFFEPQRCLSFCKFAASYLQILFNGPRRVWRCGGEMIKREVPKSI